jgi:hypothetical protein
MDDAERVERGPHGAGDQRLSDVEFAQRAALGDHQDRRDLVGHDERGERVGDEREAARLHHHGAAHAGQICAGRGADRLVLACRSDRDEIIVGGNLIDQRREHVVRHIGDEAHLVVLERPQEGIEPGHRAAPARC